MVICIRPGTYNHGNETIEASNLFRWPRWQAPKVPRQNRKVSRLPLAHGKSGTHAKRVSHASSCGQQPYAFLPTGSRHCGRFTDLRFSVIDRIRIACDHLRENVRMPSIGQLWSTFNLQIFYASFFRTLFFQSVHSHFTFDSIHALFFRFFHHMLEIILTLS